MSIMLERRLALHERCAEAVRLRQDEQLTYKVIGERFGVSATRAQELVFRGFRLRDADAASKARRAARGPGAVFIQDTELSTMTLGSLERHLGRDATLEDLARCTAPELLTLYSLGRKGLADIEAVLAAHGLRLVGVVPDPVTDEHREEALRAASAARKVYERRIQRCVQLGMVEAVARQRAGERVAD